MSKKIKYKIKGRTISGYKLYVITAGVSFLKFWVGNHLKKTFSSQQDDMNQDGPP